LVDGVHSIKATATDAAGNVSTLSAALSVTIDTAGPSVSSVTYGTHDAGLALGESVELLVNFTEIVHINFTNGTPTLTLDTGGTATYVSGTGTDSLKFSYTPLAGHTSGDLQVTSLNLLGSTIRDTAGNSTKSI
jgi:hypothetical protein